MSCSWKILHCLESTYCECYPFCLEYLPYHLHVVNSFWKVQFTDHLSHTGFSQTERTFLTTCLHRSLPLSLCANTSLCLAYGSCSINAATPKSHNTLVLPSLSLLVSQTIHASKLFPPGSQFMTQHFNFSNLSFLFLCPSFSLQTLAPHLILIHSLALSNVNTTCALQPSWYPLVISLWVDSQLLFWFHVRAFQPIFSVSILTLCI